MDTLFSRIIFMSGSLQRVILFYGILMIFRWGITLDILVVFFLNFMSIASDIEDKKDAIKLRDMRGDVEFKEVDFSYDGSESVLEKLNLKIKSGEKLTLVRPSRAGKSTVCSLIPRFYDVSSGSVAIEGCCRMITSLKKIKIYDTVQLKNKKRS